jgi:hypothetical protein
MRVRPHRYAPAPNGTPKTKPEQLGAILLAFAPPEGKAEVREVLEVVGPAAIGSKNPIAILMAMASLAREWWPLGLTVIELRALFRVARCARALALRLHEGDCALLADELDALDQALDVPGLAPLFVGAETRCGDEAAAQRSEEG